MAARGRATISMRRAPASCFVRTRGGTDGDARSVLRGGRETTPSSGQQRAGNEQHERSGE
jgi:hypothetical protein